VQEFRVADEDESVFFGQCGVNAIEAAAYEAVGDVPERKVCRKRYGIIGLAIVGSEIADVAERAILRRAFEQISDALEDEGLAYAIESAPLRSDGGGVGVGEIRNFGRRFRIEGVANELIAAEQIQFAITAEKRAVHAFVFGDEVSDPAPDRAGRVL